MGRLVVATPETIAEAAVLLRNRGLVAFSTETVYGLGANALDIAAVERIFAAKGRPSRNPLIVHVPTVDEARKLCASWPPSAEALAAQFWPGALTLVMAKNDIVPGIVTAGGSTVALRVPANPTALELLTQAGVPVAAPSANRSGGLSPTRAVHVLASLGKNVDLILDGGACSGGLESTVVDVSGAEPMLLRPGLVDRRRIEAVVGPLVVRNAMAEGALPSPGMLARHYSPTTALECTATKDEADFLEQLYRTAGLKVARYAIPFDPAVAAQSLYAELHVLDRAGHDRILVVLPPDREEWQAIRDRLTRAAAEE